MPPQSNSVACEEVNPGLSWPPLLLALFILTLLTILPGVLTDASGRADHTAALLTFSAMSAGFVRGVGFVPRNPLGRIFLSGYSCFGFFALACLRLIQNGGFPDIY